jgi:hypothetical protein
MIPGGQAMMRLRRASAILVFLMFASAATASAECAWVLWKGRSQGSDSSTPQGTQTDSNLALDSKETASGTVRKKAASNELAERHARNEEACVREF